MPVGLATFCSMAMVTPEQSHPTMALTHSAFISRPPRQVGSAADRGGDGCLRAARRPGGTGLIVRIRVAHRPIRNPTNRPVVEPTCRLGRGTE